jgi:REP element-mobilizing transposase RayT
MNLTSRRSIRLKTHNYQSPGPYFLTLCSFQRKCLFGSILSGTVHLNSTGLVIQEEWQRILEVRPEVVLDAFVIMPNHFHAIVILGQSAPSCLESTLVTARPPKSLGSLVAGFKSACTVRVNIAANTPGRPLWQKNYYERVIRSEDELQRVRKYIGENPARW